MKRVPYFYVVIVLAALFLLNFSPSVSAEEQTYTTQKPAVVHNPFYGGIFGGWVIPDDVRFEYGGDEKAKIQMDQSWTVGAKCGYILPLQWLALELEYAYLNDQDVADSKAEEYLQISNLMANLILRYPKGTIRPYIGAGAGWSWADFGASKGKSESYDDFGWQALAGINVEVMPSLSVDFGYRYFSGSYEANNATDVSIEDHNILLGLQYHFGGVEPLPPPPPVQVPVEEKKCPNTPACCVVDADGCPFDSDKDGVCDGCDKCNDTPDGCPVDANGCPADSDKDGVIDCRDKCPNTIQNCPIDKDGCPLDSDQDGVIDCKDKCSGTPEISKVDENGCPLMAVIRLYVQFDYKKTVVKPEFFNEIKKLGDFMKNHPNLNATIEGHTDNIASADYNLKLSQQRAAAVMKVLVEKEKIDSKRLTAVGYGLTKPIAGNDTEEGRAKNRRVEALLQVKELNK